MDRQSKDKRGEVRLKNWWVRQELKQIKTRAGILVYLTLRTYRKQDTGECYPGMKKLCKDTGLSRQSVSAGIRELEELGLIEVKQAKWKATNRFANNSYRVFDEATWNAEIRPKHRETRVKHT